MAQAKTTVQTEELVTDIAKRCGCTKTSAHEMLKALQACVAANVKKGKATKLNGIGIVDVVSVKAQSRKVPGVKGVVRTPAGKRVRIKASSALKP